MSAQSKVHSATYPGYSCAFAYIIHCKSTHKRNKIQQQITQCWDHHQTLTHNGPARASKPKKDAGEQCCIKKFPKRLQTSCLDHELKEFTVRAQAEAAAAVNAAEPPPAETSETCLPPAPYELDDRMDITEDPVAQDPETASIVLTDEQLAEELLVPKRDRNLLLEGEDVSALCTYFHTMLPLEHGIL